MQAHAVHRTQGSEELTQKSSVMWSGCGDGKLPCVSALLAHALPYAGVYGIHGNAMKSQEKLTNPTVL